MSEILSAFAEALVQIAGNLDHIALAVIASGLGITFAILLVAVAIIAKR